MRLLRVSSALLLFAAAGLPLRVQAQDRPEYIIHRAGTPMLVDGRLEETAWLAAPAIESFVFPWHAGGKTEQTVAKVLWDDTFLYLAFICEDAHIWAIHTKHDSQVWLDDTVEIFTSPDPDRPEAYFNIEMNVLSIFLDQFHPTGPGSRPDEEWDSHGVQIKTTIVGTLNDDTDEDSHWVLEAAIPFSNFSQVARNTPPRPGDVWNLNLNRLGGNTNPQHSQWSASRTPRPAFHAPSDFGRVIFSEGASPFGL